MSKFSKGIKSLNNSLNNFFKIFTSYLLIMLYSLTKFEAHSCYTFWDILITKFHYDHLKGHSSTKGDNPNFKLEDLKVPRRSPDLLNNVKIGQGQLQLIMELFLFYHIWGLLTFWSSDLNNLICLFDLILYVPSTIFQLNRDWSSLVEPVLS